MLLRQLFEAANNEVAIIFGRFNPPHKGHRAAWEMASKSPVWFVGTNESTVGPKDPLPFDVKVEAMKTVWPKVEGHIVAETSWLTLASKVFEQYPKATLLCLTDEDWVTKTIIQYNGKEGSHGFYNFPNIKQSPTPRLSSATALRDAVAKGDREAFSQAAGVSADTKVAGKPFFDLVAEYLMPYQNAPKKVAKKKKDPEVTEVAVAGETIPTTEFVKGIYSLAAEFGNEAPNPEAVKKMMVLAPNQEVDVQKTFQKIISTFQAQLPKIKKMMDELDAIIKQAEQQGVEEAFGPLPREKQQIRLGRHTVDIERVGLDKNYISFAWHDSQGQEHYEEVAVGDLGSYDDLIKRIKDEIRYQERQYTDQGVAEDWNKVNKKDKTDGLSQKAVNAYRRENPGSKLKTAVTTKPSKLKAGSKDAKRRKSFCARMSGNKGPMKDEKGRPTPKAKALSRWNC